MKSTNSETLKINQELFSAFTQSSSTGRERDRTALLTARERLQNVKGLPPNFDFLIDNRSNIGPAQLIVDGFTARAIKNVLRVENNTLLVFSVTKTSIELSSKSDLITAQNSPPEIQAPSLRPPKLIFYPDTLRLLVIDPEAAEGLILTLSSQKGQVEHIKKVKNIPFPTTLIRTLRPTERVNNRSAFFYGLKDDQEAVQILRPGRQGSFLTSWMTAIINPDLKEKFFRKMMSIPDDHDLDEISMSMSGFTYLDEWWSLQIHPYNKGRFSLLILNNQSLIHFKLLDLRRRKVLRSKGYILDNLIEFEKMKRLYRLPLNFRTLSNGQTERRSYNWQGVFRTQFCDQSMSLVLEVRSGWVSFFVRLKVENLFIDIKAGALEQEEVFFGNRNFFLDKFDEKRSITMSKHHKDTENDIRKFVWLDPETLEEEEINGLENHPLFPQMVRFPHLGVDSKSIEKIGEESILLTDDISAFLYSHKEGRVLQRCILLAGTHQRSLDRVLKTGPYYVWGHYDHIFFFETTELEDGEERLESIKDVYLGAHYPGIGPDLHDLDFSLSRLQSSGNFILVTRKTFVDEVIYYDDPYQHEYFQSALVVEIDPSTLRVVQTDSVKINQSSKLDVMRYGSFHLVHDNLLVGIAIEIQNQAKMILFDGGLKVLYESPRVLSLRGAEVICSVSGRSVVAEAAPQGLFYLFEIDPQKRSIVLVKQLKLDCCEGPHTISVSSLDRSEGFRCLVEGEEGEAGYLHFNSELELTDCWKVD